MTMKKYQTEAELCQEKIDLLRSLGWKVYPEWGIWDFFCTYQTKTKLWTLGIQAKLKWNINVLRQCLESQKYAHWTVALIGSSGRRTTTSEYEAVANGLGILFYYGHWKTTRFCNTFQKHYDIWSLQYFIELTNQAKGKNKGSTRYGSYWYRNLKNPYNPKPIIKELPTFEPDMPGGVQSPGGYPTPFTLGVRKVVEHMKATSLLITVKQASVISDIPISSIRHVFDNIAERSGQRGRSYLYKLKTDGESEARRIYSAGWLDELAISK